MRVVQSVPCWGLLPTHPPTAAGPSLTPKGRADIALVLPARPGHGSPPASQEMPTAGVGLVGSGLTNSPGCCPAPAGLCRPRSAPAASRLRKIRGNPVTHLQCHFMVKPQPFPSSFGGSAGRLRSMAAAGCSALGIADLENRLGERAPSRSRPNGALCNEEKPNTGVAIKKIYVFIIAFG